MKVLLLLLLLAPTPIAGHNSGNTRTSPLNSVMALPTASAEEKAARAEADTAYWTKMLAFSTVFLGVITVAVTILDVRVNDLRRREDARIRLMERHNRKKQLLRDGEEKTLNSLRDLEQVLWFFNRRCAMLEKNSALRAELLMRGFDAAMGRALASDIANSLNQELAEQVYASIFEAHDTFAYAAVVQNLSSGLSSSGNVLLNAEVQGRARSAEMVTSQAAKLVRERRERLRDLWNFPVEVLSFPAVEE